MGRNVHTRDTVLIPGWWSTASYQVWSWQDIGLHLHLIAGYITRPYMHVGLFDNLEGVINIYNAGGGHPRRKKTPEEEADPMYPEPAPFYGR